MIELQSKRNAASVKVFTDELDKPTRQQIAATARDPAYADSTIRVMPDTHAGRSCVIGMTMTLHGRVSPSLVGVDIGCGMEVVKLDTDQADLPALDHFIRQSIPVGKHLRDTPMDCDTPLSDLICKGSVDVARVLRSMGTLGGGNHFIELERDGEGRLYLVIHAGSRSLGAAVAGFYRDEAYRYHLKKARRARRTQARDDRALEDDGFGLSRFGIDGYEDGHRQSTRPTKAARRDTRDKLPVKWETAVCEGQLYEDYLHDQEIALCFAEENRRRMAEAICDGLGLPIHSRFSCVHNYVDSHRILRKGAISARQGERVFIPLNMRDGSLIGRGLGNPDWNFSAPHGAGRACSRTDARHAYDVETYRAIMREAGVYTTTADADTLDECPMAYKSPDRILPYLSDCVEVEERLIPIYNFKAGND